jgi:NADPH:quinone reductase-like Zn-dependent oxidoreductase
MRQVVLQNSFGIENLIERSAEKPAIRPDEILVRMHAAALNGLDLAVVETGLGMNLPLPLIPVADGAGTIEAVGADISGFQVGELVTTLFVPPWRSGRYLTAFNSPALRPGLGAVAGQLSEYKVFRPNDIIHAPRGLSPTEAATLPVAALTAWNALSLGRIKPGDPVLIHGTGGVSVFALQFAKMFGAEVIITSSSDEKLAKAAKLGADVTINYKSHPDIVAEIMRATANEGVALTVETVGGANVAKSQAATRPHGHVSMVGLQGGMNADINLMLLNMSQATLTGVNTGSAQDFADMNAAISQNGLRPVVDATFPLEHAAEAFRHLKSGSHFGKVVVTL